jgi:hypothetical protein
MTRLELMFECAGFEKPVWGLPVAVPSWVRRGLIGWRVVPEQVDAGVPEPVARLIASALVSHSRVTFAERPTLSLVHTTDAGAAQRLFDSEGFDWTMGAQVVFLSAPSAPPPAVSEAHMRAAFDGAQFDGIAGTGATGLLLPGVDGDVAGLYAFSDRLWDGLASALRCACRNSGAVWREVEEGEFSELVAGQRPD